MGTIYKIVLGGHSIRFERKWVRSTGMYQNVYIRHVGTNNRLTTAQHNANVYVESLFALGLSRLATISEFKSFVYDEDLRLQNEALAAVNEALELERRIAEQEFADAEVLRMTEVSIAPVEIPVDGLEEFEGDDDRAYVLLLGGAAVLLLILLKK